MKKVVAVSGISAVIYSVFRIDNLSRIWVFPVSFIGFCLLFSLLIWFFLWLVSLPIQMNMEYDKPSGFYYKLLNYEYRFTCEAARVKIHVNGIDKIPTNKKYLLVSNHRSRFDPMIESLVLEDKPMAFISKQSNFTIPIGRRYIKRCCYLAIDRENPRNALRTINQAASFVSSNTMSVAVYPEGHRGQNETLQEFKPGCLKIALKANCPIVVTTIRGTEKIHHHYPFHKTDVYFDIIDVIIPEQKKTPVLSDKIRAQMQNHLDLYTSSSKCSSSR